MKLIVISPPEHVAEAWRVLNNELCEFDKYDRVGWGWSFARHDYPASFFVRRIKDGLSVRVTERALKPTGATNG